MEVVWVFVFKSFCSRSGLFVDCASVSNCQQNDSFRRFVKPIDYPVIAYSEAVAAFKLSPQSLAGIGLSLKDLDLLIDSTFEVWRKLPEVFLEL
jgi:hypothetical protein